MVFLLLLLCSRGARAELKTVRDMWHHHLDALLDVQPSLKEALAERGLSEAAVFLEAAGDGGGGGAAGSSAGQGEEGRVDAGGG